MKFFLCKQPYSVCSVCRVHFEPAPKSEELWGNYCDTHRKPVMERDRRMIAVRNWAMANWEKLEPQYFEYKKAQDDRNQQYANLHIGGIGRSIFP